MWPDLYDLIARKVRPARMAQGRDARAKYWWRFAETAPALYRTIAGKKRVLVRSLTSASFATFTFLPIGMVYDQTLIVFAFDTHSAFVTLDSRCHEVWSLFFGGSIGETPRYNPARCFETFPFPEGFEFDTKMEPVGQNYFAFRANLMVGHNEGLTKTYNRFHNPDERDLDILKLRELHDAMDRAVLNAYGWTDLKPTCEFILDYEEEENDDGKPRRKKKPWRYRWPDEFRDEVLARLLALNQQRAAQERVMATTVDPGRRSNKVAGKRRSVDPRKPLFD
jgi:hypothetical protein